MKIPGSLNAHVPVPSLVPDLEGKNRFNNSVIGIWESVGDTDLSATYLTKTGGITVKADWSKVIRLFRRECRFYRRFLQRDYAALDEMARFEYASVRITVDGNLDKSEWELAGPQRWAELYLYDCFLAFNLCCPGSFSLKGGSLHSKDGGKTYRHELTLTSEPIYYAWTMFWDLPFNARPMPSFDRCWDWVKNMRPNCTVIARTPSQKALFAILKLCKDQELSAETVVLLSHALEALCPTLVGQSLSGLKSQIRGILDFSEYEVSFFNKQLRKFYNIRNAFAHGGFENSHPLGDSELDEAMYGQWDKLWQAASFGTGIVFSLLHKLIEEKRSAFSLESPAAEIGR